MREMLILLCTFNLTMIMPGESFPQMIRRDTKSSTFSSPRLLSATGRVFWGNAKVTYFDDRNLFVGAGGSIMIFKVVSRDSISLVNSFYLPSEVQDIVVRRDTLFATDLINGLQIFDVTDVVHPKQVVTLPLGHHSYGICLDSNTIFVAHGNDGISRIDIADVGNPQITGALKINCNKFTKHDAYLYCVSDDTVTIVDPFALDSLGSIPVMEQSPFGDVIQGIYFTRTKSLLVENHYCDVGPNCSWSYVTFLDNSAPTSPVRMSYSILPEEQRGIVTRGDTLFCINRDTLTILDVNQAVRAAIISRTPNFSGDALSLHDSILCASTDYIGEVSMIDVADLRAPSQGATFETSSDVGSVCAQDSVLVVGRFDGSGISLVDTRNISHPEILCRYTSAIGPVRGIAIQTDIVFAASQYGLKILRIHWPDSLSLLGQLDLGGWSSNICVRDTLVAMDGGPGGIHLISVSDPSHPILLANVSPPAGDFVNGIFIRDTLLFIGMEYGGPSIYTIRNPGSPALLWSTYIYNNGAIFPENHTLYVSDYAKLLLFDMTNPSSPTAVDSIQLYNDIRKISAQDSLAFVCMVQPDIGFVVVKSSPGTSVVEVAEAHAPGWQNSIFTNDKYVFLSDYIDGVYIYDYTSLLTDVGKSRVSSLKTTYHLAQNYPNPFNPSTTISFSLPKSSFVTIKIYNVLGQLISTLVNEHRAPGTCNVQFDASNLPSGVYYYRLSAGDYVDTKKMLVIK